jgi:hypothetical protein
VNIILWLLLHYTVVEITDLVGPDQVYVLNGVESCLPFVVLNNLEQEG